MAEITLAELSPFDLRREHIGRQLENMLLTHREHRRELRAIEREERAERLQNAAKRARKALVRA